MGTTPEWQFLDPAGIVGQRPRTRFVSYQSVLHRRALESPSVRSTRGDSMWHPEGYPDANVLGCRSTQPPEGERSCMET